MGRYLNVFFLLFVIISLFAAVLFPASAAFASPLLAPALSVTKTDALIGDDGDGKADPGEIIEYTVTIPNAGTDATGIVFDDNPDANTTLVNGSTAASPVAVNDTYPATVIGNVSINSALISYSVVSNDFLGVNPTATISAFDATSANGGQVTMTTSGAGLGQFTYNPPPGFEGTDSFTYTLTDNANASSAASNRTATVSIPVSGMVWFINNGAAACTTLAAGCGRLSNPFSTLAAFNTLNNSTGNNPAANDNIFVYESASQYTGAVTLLSGQKLIGQDATASLSTITGLTPPSSSPTFPSMNSGNGTVTNLGSTVTLNTNATLRGLQINSTSSTALNDPVGAITGISVSDMSVSSTTATAVVLSDVAGTFTFTSISSSGGTSDGISITNQTGSFTVNGDGSNTSVGGNSTGGTIQNKSGSDLSTTSGIGIYLNNVQNITLRRMTINGTNQNYGIRGTLVNGFVLEYSTVGGTNGTAASLASPENYGEGAIHFGNATTNGVVGTVTFINNSISGGRGRNLSIVNTTAGTTTLTVKGNTFAAIQNFSDGGTSFAVEARVSSGVIVNTTFGGTNPGEGNTLTSAVGDLVNFTGQQNTTMDVVMRNNSLSDNHAFNISGGGGLTLATAGTMTFHVTGNTMRDANGSAVTLFKASALSGAPSMSGFFDNNTIGVAGVTDSGSKTGNGIFVSAGGTGTMSYTITNNIIHQIHGNAHIYADNTGGSYTANFDIRGNTLDTPGAGWFAGIAVTNGSPSSSDTINVCAKIGGSTAADKNTLNLSGNLGVIVGSSGAAAGHTFNLPGFPGPATQAAVESFLTNNNTGSFTTNAYADAPATFAAFTGVGTNCSTPIAMAPNNAQLLAQMDGDNTQVAATNPNSGNGFKQTSYTFTKDASNTSVIGTHASKLQLAPAQSGGIVSVNIGTLPAGKSVVIKFRVTVNGPALPLGTFQISNQGTLSGSNFSSVLTDDPAVGGASDPTTTPVDRPDTTVTSINRDGSSPTNTSSVSWTVTFADAVISLTSNNLTLVSSGLGGTPAITGVTAIGATPATQWTVTASTGTGDGTLGLNLTSDTGLSHDVTNLSFTGQVYTLDRTPPTVTMSSAVPNPTNSSPIPVTVQFSETVNNFIATDITPGNATVGNFISVDGDTFTFNLTPSAPGLVTANIAVGVAQDSGGNGNTAATQFSRTFDGDAPTVTMSSPATNPTTTSPIPVTVQFSESVTGFGVGDITPGNATMGNFVAMDGDTYTFDLTPSGDGLVTADIPAGVAQDGSGNLNSAASQFSRTFDTLAPDVTINQAAGQADPTSASPINFTVVFSEPVSGFGNVAGDVNLSGTAGATTAVVTEIAPNDGATYNVAVSGITSSGTVIASVPAVSALDAAGHSNTASTSMDNTVTFIFIVDSTPPSVSSVHRADPSPTGAASVNFTVTFSESVTDVDLSDFTLTATGVSGASVGNMSGSGATYTVTVNTGTGSGTIRLDVVDDDSIRDAANNPLGGIGNGNGSYVSSEVYAIIKTNGADTTGVYRPSNGVLYLKNTNTTGFADVALNYGVPGDYPVVGDWDGNGTDTIGIYRNGMFYLRNSNTLGFADILFPFGAPGDQPIAGDWNGDGVDTVGIFRNGLFLLRNSNGAGAADMSFFLGIVGDVGIAGDWDGDGIDTTGVFRPSNGIIFLKNTNSTGFGDVALNYGILDDKPVTGDWDNDGIDTIGVYRNGIFYLRNSNTPGFGEVVFALGIPGDMPIAGNWDGVP